MYFNNTETAIIYHYAGKGDVVYTNVYFLYNVMTEISNGLISFLNPAYKITFNGGVFSNNKLQNGVVNIRKNVNSRVLLEKRQKFNKDIRVSWKRDASKDQIDEFYYDSETETVIREKQEFYDRELFEGRNDRNLASIVYDVQFTSTTFENNKGIYGAAIYA